MPSEKGCGWDLFSPPYSLSTFVQVGVVRTEYGGRKCALCKCWWYVSVAMGLMGVLGRLLGGRGISHAALGQ